MNRQSRALASQPIFDDITAGAWLATTARNRAINRIRRDRTLAAKTRLLQVPQAAEDTMNATFPDERLELIFTCCHPALSVDRALALLGRGPYVVQAAIASLHADEPRDWPQIAEP